MIRAATAVLDRTGLGPNATVTLDKAPEAKPWTAWLTNEQLAQIGSWIAEAKQRMASGVPIDNRSTVAKPQRVIEAVAHEAL